MCYKKSKLDLYPVGYVSVEDLQRVAHLINQGDNSKLQTDYKRAIELVDDSGNRSIINLEIDWKQKQEESMKSNIKYYTSLEMVEKIKNGFGEKLDDGSVRFEAGCTFQGSSHIKHIKYTQGNFYYYKCFDGLELLPVDTSFWTTGWEPAFKPIQPKIVHIDFHGVVIPAFEHEISEMNYISCDKDGLIRVYAKTPILNVSIFSPTHGGYRYLNHIYKYEGDWKQSCTEIKLVECKQ